jgi:flagellar hook-associated protein FlgK
MTVSGLDTALSGLRLAQAQMDVIATNIANVSTPGYTRKILPQEAESAAGIAIGVRASKIIRSVNLDLERDFWTQVSGTKFFEVQQQYLGKIQQFHGPPDQELSIAAQISALRDNFVALASRPDDLFLIEATVSQAELTADKISDFSKLITQMRSDAQDEIFSAVTRVNDILQIIANVNQRIKANQNIGRSTASLEDERDNAILELTDEMEVTFFTRGDGVLVVQTSTGGQLADENAEELYFRPLPANPDTVYIGAENTNNSLSGLWLGGDPTVNRSAFDIAASSPGGRIGALLELRDEILPQHTAQIDELAFRMAQRFESAGVKLFTDGVGNIPSDIQATITGTSGQPVGTDLVAAAGGNDSFRIILDPNGPEPKSAVIDMDTARGIYGDGVAGLVDYMNNDVFPFLSPPFNQTEASLVNIGVNETFEITSPFEIQLTGESTDTNPINPMGNTLLETLFGVPTTVASPDPIPDSPGPLTPAPYIGFAEVIQVNENIINDNTLIRNSTLSGLTVQEGSNEFIRRIAENVFGDTAYQEAYFDGIDDATPNDINVTLSAINVNVSQYGGIPIADRNYGGAFGLVSEAQLVGSVDLRTLGSTNDTLSNAPGNPYSPATDAFTLRFDNGGLNDTGIINIDLSDAEAFSALTNGGDQLVDYLNNSIIAGLGAPLNNDITASLNPFGQLVINSQVSIEVGSGTMGEDGLSFLGLESGTIDSIYPSFDIYVGNNDPVTISIDPSDTETELQDKINAVNGVRAYINPTNGRLSIRPGEGFGGDLRLVSGPTLSIAGSAANNTGGNTVLFELFGTEDPITDMPHFPFRNKNLGAGANINSGILGVTNLISYAEKMISKQTEVKLLKDARFEDEKTFRDLLQRQLLDESGVNVEEELSNMIMVQTAFSAAGRIVQALDEMLEELVNIAR